MSGKRFASSRFVLRSYPAREEVQYFAESLGWVVASTEKKAPPFSGTEIIWSSSGGEALRYMEDEMTGNCYVTVEASTGEEVQRLGEAVVDELLPWEREELVFAVDTASDEMEFGLAVIRLSIAAPRRTDETILQRVRSALTHDDARVRDMGIVATTYSPWPEYVPLLRDIAQGDSEHKLRERSRSVLESYAAAGVGEDE
ncbi:hypothetical protein [Streptomyces sp. NPDC050534]|uniref:hypothetical protein n=1 Tax=Streptomyces sp. NPDC050534 TaxID=3365625 RepID=UPI0037B22DE0